MSRLPSNRCRTITLIAICLIAIIINAHAQDSSQSPAPLKETLSIPPDVQKEIDSLKALVPLSAGTDRLKLYGRISWAYAATRTHLELALAYADSLRLGAESLHDEASEVLSHFYYGFIARHEGNFSKALDHFNKYISYYMSRGDSVKVATALFQVGVINHDRGNYNESLAAYYRVLAQMQKAGDDYQVASTLNSIGIIFKKMKRYSDAIEKYEAALSIFDRLKVEDRGYVRTNIANLYSEKNEFARAAAFYKQAVLINREYGNNVEIAVCLQNMGNMFNKMQQYDSGLIYHLQCYEMLQHTSQQWEIAQSLCYIGFTYLKMGSYAIAEQTLRHAMEMAAGIKAKPLQRDIYENLSLLYGARKDFARAYQYHQLYSSIKDSVLTEETTRQLGELQVKYETGEKDRQILLLAAEKEIEQREAQRQAILKTISIAGLVVVSLLTLLLIYIFRQRLKSQKFLTLKNNEVKEADFRRQLSELEMKALRAQINPHFLFNCMNSINTMILKGESGNASLYLTRFSKLVRMILENAEGNTVSLKNELTLLQSYIEMEGLRFKGKITCNISVDEAIEPENTYMPSMVLQPFVENAIWHGLMHKQDNESGNIYIGVKEEEDRLLCTIEDNGVGREKAEELRERSLLKSKSLGMKITEERLKLLSKAGEEPVLIITDLKDIFNHPSGTRIQINIPIC